MPHNRKMSIKGAELPRVLVINPVVFSQDTASGITTVNLFRNWPQGRIAQIHSSPDSVSHKDYSVCQQYFYIPTTGFRDPLSNPLKQVSEFLFRQRDCLGNWIVNPAKALEWARNFKPDLIYARPHDCPAFYCWLPRWLAQDLKVPYITHMMDDWPAQFEQKQSLLNSLIRNPILQRSLRLLFAQASANIGISSEMQTAYLKRYGYDFVPFHNCINVSEWNTVKPKLKNSISDNFELVYMGSVTEIKELQSLIDIKNAVLALKQEGFAISMSIYGPEYYESVITQKLQTGDTVRYMGFVEPALKSSILASADALILPVNFDFESFPFMRYSFQTKLPEYMAAGRPVLLYGPATNPNIRYAAQGNWSVVVDQPDSFALQTAVKKLVNNPNFCKELGENARKAAFRDHDCKDIRSRFEALMASVAYDNNRIK